MQKIKYVLWGLLLGLTGWWLLADPVLGVTPSFFALRNSLINYTGLLGMAMMSVGMVLAVRPVWFEPHLGGLDKMYRLHKWMGIGGLVVSIAHWLLSNVPKWLMGAGLMAPPAGGRPPRVEQTVEIFKLFQGWRGLAEGVGEWAFYGTVLMIVLALVKRFPYKLFFKTHRVLAVTYLALVLHGLVLMNFSYWRQGLAPFMALLMVAGSASAAVVLFRRVGEHRKVSGVIESVERFDGLQVLYVALRLDGRWPGHQAGQFAFVNFDTKEGAHPFTISSAWHDDGSITFLIKELGDYTRTLPSYLEVGHPAEIEGPYGQFTFQGIKRRQIWVGAGIGITPFVARMKTLAGSPDGKQIDLFHTTAAMDPRAIEKMEADAAAAGVQLHVLLDSRDGRLDAERLCAAVPGWREADLWFCGPPAFGRALKTALLAQGLPLADFHQELFEMR
jgi:predicted ferric reductase